MGNDFKGIRNQSRRFHLKNSRFYTRTASVLRKLAVAGVRTPEKGVTVARLASLYGCSKNRGMKPWKHVPASKSILRAALRNLKNLGMVEENEKGKKISKKGAEFIDNIVSESN